MSWYIELLDSLSFFLFTLVLYFLSAISKRLGEVMIMKKYYYLYSIGMFFTLSGSVIMTPQMAGFENRELYGYVFFGVGLTFGLFASIKYWGWLIKELIKGI